MKKVISEQQLVNIVMECTKRALNEIGDSPEGRAMLRRASGLAMSKGRPRQGELFAGKANAAFGERYGSGADTVDVSSSHFRFKNVGGNESILYRDARIGAVGGGSASNVMEKAKTDPSVVKTRDPRTARNIAAWCQEILTQSAACPPEVTDWHFWYAQ